MILKDISFSDPVQNILYDEVLLHLAEKEGAGEFLRFWESPQLFVVLGRICKVEEDLKTEALKADHVPVLRRASGGGTVLQGQGCLNYSLVISKHREKGLSDIGQSYQVILQYIINALRRLDVNVGFWPISDLAHNESKKKFSGNAQKRGKEYILHHGTILYNFDLSLIERYLKIPKSIPDYRGDRGHLDFVCNIPLEADDIKSSIQKEFRITENVNIVSEQEKALMGALKGQRDVCISLLSDLNNR
ncbi:MAG: lipoate--protein ligase family protein [Candidatus Omnitrophica bacterium]|nr:lipoate--protein ligase family protein [Candidatus Omnitrophota bacterium]